MTDDDRARIATTAIRGMSTRCDRRLEIGGTTTRCPGRLRMTGIAIGHAAIIIRCSVCDTWRPGDDT